MKTFEELYEELREASHLYTSKGVSVPDQPTPHLYTSKDSPLLNLKIGDKVGGKLHANSPIAHTHGIVTKIEPHPIHGHMVHYKVGEDKYGDVIHKAGIKHIIKEDAIPAKREEFITKNGVKLKTTQHYNNHEMAHFLKKPENKSHEFVGHDKYGKPHTIDKNENQD